jgi:prolyl 4-hydroxylase
MKLSILSSANHILLTILLSTYFQTPIRSEEDYGVDTSFPMHRPHIEDPANILPNRQEIYDEYVEGCRQKYPEPKGICEDSENGRVDMALAQPQSMQNYTDLGFTKIKTPPKVWELLQEFWKSNDPTGDIHTAKAENWSRGNSYANHWVSPTYMVSVEDTSLRGGGYKLKDAIWDAARETLQEWTGEELQPCSLYGIRIYTEGAILATHVDRLPLVSSAIVNVAQDVDEEWPIEVIGHDGRAHNITMEPGDMVLYESHSVLHGRPFALKGRYFANVFIHFEPTGHTLRHKEKMDALDHDDELNVDKQDRDSVMKGHGGHENEAIELPPYILKGTPQAKKWLAEHKGRESAVMETTNGSTEAHLAVQEGRVASLRSIIEEKKELIHAQDENGWTPLHEAARSGSVEAVKLLVENGADMNVKTRNGETALYIAEHTNTEEHPVIDLLEEMGALFEGPEL